MSYQMCSKSFKTLNNMRLSRDYEASDITSKREDLCANILSLW